MLRPSSLKLLDSRIQKQYTTSTITKFFHAKLQQWEIQITDIPVHIKPQDTWRCTLQMFRKHFMKEDGTIGDQWSDILHSWQKPLLWRGVPVGFWVGPLASSCLYLLPSGCSAFLSVSAVRGTHSGPQDTCEIVEEATHNGKKIVCNAQGSLLLFTGEKYSYLPCIDQTQFLQHLSFPEHKIHR